MRAFSLLIIIASAALSLASPAAALDQLLGQARINGAGQVVMPGGPILGRWQAGKYTATPDAIQVQGDGSTAKGMRFGGNRGDVLYGLQIGGAMPEDGVAGVVNRLEGHASWQGLFPSRDVSSMELAVHTNASSGLATGTAGGNTLVWTVGKGRGFSQSWAGRKIYFNNVRLRIATVASDGNSITVTNLDGSPYTFPATVTEVYKFFYVYGTGTANISGTAMQRIVGDPFLPFLNDPAFELRVNGVKRTVTSFTDTKNITLAQNNGNLTNATYEFFWDANDQITTFRLHGSQDDTENLSLFTRYDGYWIASQYGDYGKYRDIRVSSGELPYSPGSPNQQIVVHRNGDTSFGGDYNFDVLRIPAQTYQRTGFFVMQPGGTDAGPSLMARSAGSSGNAGMNLDMQGAGTFSVSSGNFAQTAFQVFGTTATGQGWLAAYAYSTPAIQAQGPATIPNIAAALLGKGNSGALTGAFIRTADPTTGDIPTNQCADWQNTSAGTFKHVCNFGGTLRSVAMQ